MGKFFKIDPSLPTPIFQQVVEAIERRILNGEYAVGAFLPSVRDLAVDLAINPNTVARAYQLLQQSGAVETQRGLGLRVKAVGERDRGQRRQDLLQAKCEELVETAETLRISWPEVLEELQKAKKGRAKWRPQAL